MNGPQQPARPPDTASTPSPFKSRGGGARLFGALRYSARGLVDAFRREAAFRQELALAAVLIPIGIIAPFSPVERALLLGSVALVLIVELLNSSIEAVVDLVSPAKHSLAGKAKDLGSAAVMLALLLCGFTWLTIAGPVLFGLARQFV